MEKWTYYGFWLLTKVLEPEVRKKLIIMKTHIGTVTVDCMHLVLPIRRRDGSDCFLSYSYQCLSPQGLWMKFTRRSNIKEASEEAPSSRDIPFFYTYLYVSCMCVNMCANGCMRVMCACRDMHVEVGGQLLRTSFPFTMWVPGLSSDPWV